MGQLSTTQQAAAPAAADADAERASAAHGVSAPGRRELFFGHGKLGHLDPNLVDEVMRQLTELRHYLIKAAAIGHVQ